MIYLNLEVFLKLQKSKATQKRKRAKTVLFKGNAINFLKDKYLKCTIASIKNAFIKTLGLKKEESKPKTNFAVC